MAPIAVRLTGLAVQTEQRRCDNDIATTSKVIGALLLLNDAQLKCEAAIAGAANTAIDSPARLIARQAQNVLIGATAAVAKLAGDYPVGVKLRAQQYVPVQDHGRHFCPECWTKKHLRVGLKSSMTKTKSRIYRCPTCDFERTFET